MRLPFYRTKNYYTIQNDENTKLGIIRTCLSEDGKFYIATAKPLKFKTRYEASRYWYQHHAELGCKPSIHIRGPRNGFHHINCHRTELGYY